MRNQEHDADITIDLDPVQGVHHRGNLVRIRRRGFALRRHVVHTGMCRYYLCEVGRLTQLKTLATMSLSGDSTGFTMSSSKGACGISSGGFSCGSGVSASTFTAVGDAAGDLLVAYQGSTAFSSSGTPSGSTVEAVHTGSSQSVDFTLVISS
jgi:hypothetical protein